MKLHLEVAAKVPVTKRLNSSNQHLVNGLLNSHALVREQAFSYVLEARKF